MRTLRIGKREIFILQIFYTKQAQKALESMPQRDRLRLKNAIENLPNGDVKPLTGKPPYKRLRVGSIRIIFKENEEKIFIFKIASRGDAYKGGF